MDCELLAWCSLKPEAQAAWAQAFFSVGAVLAAVLVARKQSALTRDLFERQRAADDADRRLRARPKLWGERIIQREDPQLQIILRNDGLGPAVIKSFDVFVDLRPVRVHRQTFWLSVIGELDLPKAIHSGGTTIQIGRVIAAGASVCLLRYQAEAPDLLPNSVILREQRRVDLIIIYESIYGERDRYSDLDDDPGDVFTPEVSAGPQA